MEQGRERWSSSFFNWINITILGFYLEGSVTVIMSRRGSCTIYVGNLPGDVREREIEDLFYKYGPIVDIDLKLPSRPPCYCFIEFEDPRDADDAIRGRDGYDFDGYQLRVELAHGGRGPPPSSDRYSSHYSGSSGRSGVSRRSDYRVIVSGLPSSASWQDLKDHMRRAGDVCFAQVFREGGGTMGIVDYTNYEDMKYAIRKLDDSQFRNPFSRSYIRVREDKSHRSYSHSPSCSWSRSRSPSFSRSRSRSRSSRPSLPLRSRSRSLSASRSFSRSPSKLSNGSSQARNRSVSHSCSRSPSLSRKRSPSESRSRSANPRPQANDKAARQSYSPSSED